MGKNLLSNEEALAIEQKILDVKYGRFLSLVQQTGGANTDHLKGEHDPEILSLINERYDLHTEITVLMEGGLVPDPSVSFPKRITEI